MWAVISSAICSEAATLYIFTFFVLYIAKLQEFSLV